MSYQQVNIKVCHVIKPEGLLQMMTLMNNEYDEAVFFGMRELIPETGNPFQPSDPSSTIIIGSIVNSLYHSRHLV